MFLNVVCAAAVGGFSSLTLCVSVSPCVALLLQRPVCGCGSSDTSTQHMVWNHAAGMSLSRPGRSSSGLALLSPESVLSCARLLFFF